MGRKPKDYYEKNTCYWLVDIILIALFNAFYNAFTRCLYFHFARSLTISFTMDEAKSRVVNIAINFS